MTGLLSLPNELLQTIGNDLGPCKKELRLVCLQLSFAMDPLVLSHIVINVTKPRLLASIAQLEYLAQGQHATHYIRELSIRSLAPCHQPQTNVAQMVYSHGQWSDGRTTTLDGINTTEKQMKGVLEAAISNMHNLKVVRWTAMPDDPKWAQIAAINGLARNHLTYFNLHLSFGSDASELRLDRLHGLKRIVISGSCDRFHDLIIKRLGTCVAQSPDMSSIIIDRSHWYKDSDVPSLHSLLGNASPIKLKHLGLQSWYIRLDTITLPHLRYLTSLTLTKNIIPPYDDHSYSSTPKAIWKTLQDCKVNLERISTDAICTSLIEYLASYSGLTRLYLKNFNLNEQRSSDELAQSFYDLVLNQHTNTLEDLYVSPILEGKWCFGSHNSASIARCQKLQYIKFAVVSSDVVPEGGSKQDPITLLIDTCARYLHEIKSLVTCTARPEFIGGAESKKHFSFATSRIVKSIINYIPEPENQAFLPTITMDSVKYIPTQQDVALAMDVRYRRK